MLCLVALSIVSYSLFLNWYDERLTNSELYGARPWSYWVTLCGFTAGWIVFASFEKHDNLCAVSARFSTPIWLGFTTILALSYFGRINSQALLFLFPFMVLAATESAYSHVTPAEQEAAAPSQRHFLPDLHDALRYVPLIFQLLRTLGHLVDIVLSRAGRGTFTASVYTYFWNERPARDAIRRGGRTSPTSL